MVKLYCQSVLNSVGLEGIVAVPSSSPPRLNQRGIAPRCANTLRKSTITIYSADARHFSISMVRASLGNSPEYFTATSLGENLKSVGTEIGKTVGSVSYTHLT